jgi:hypothetical protein
MADEKKIQRHEYKKIINQTLPNTMSLYTFYNISFFSYGSDSNNSMNPKASLGSL